jgi:hypothetical protein
VIPEQRMALDEVRAFAQTPRAALLERCFHHPYGDDCSIVFAPRSGAPVAVPFADAFEVGAEDRPARLVAALPMPDGRWLIHVRQPVAESAAAAHGYWELGDVDLVLVLGPQGAIEARRTFVWPADHLAVGDRLLALRDGSIPGLLVEQLRSTSRPLVFYGLDSRDQGTPWPVPSYDVDPCVGPPAAGPGILAVTSTSSPRLKTGMPELDQFDATTVQTLVEYRDGGRCFRRTRLRPVRTVRDQGDDLWWPANELQIETHGSTAILERMSERDTQRVTCGYRPEREKRAPKK